MDIELPSSATGRTSADSPYGALASGWVRALLLGTIFILLAALLVVPPWIGRRADALRDRLTDVVFPAQEALLDRQVAVSEALAALRAYEATGDTLTLEAVRGALERERIASDRLNELARQLGPETLSAVEISRAQFAAWVEASRALLTDGVTSGALIDSIAEVREHLDAAFTAAEGARTALDVSTRELERRIVAAVRLERGLVVLLSLAALTVALAVAWLVNRLHRISTQLHQRAERLRQSEERFRLIAENLREMIWISDPDYTIQYYLSPAYEKIWGRPLEQARTNPRSFLESVLPEDRSRVEEALENYGRGEYEAQYRIMQPGGNIRWIWARAYPVRDAKGQVIYVVGLAEDITAQKLAEQEREQLLESERQARAQTEAALRMRDRVLRIVSHDLKNPLHTIGMAAEVLKMRLPDERRTQQLEIIRRTVDRANRMVMDLLDAARIQSGQAISIQPQPLPVGPLLAEAVEAFRLQAEQKCQRLVCETADGVSHVLADNDRLHQVLSNLIGNAVKFTPEGGLIRVTAEPEANGMVRFSVSDTGPGIPQELLPRLFQPFAQAADTASLGTGLGLAISKGIVEAHGGEIQAHTVPGEGTTFTFTLPAARGRS